MRGRRLSRRALTLLLAALGLLLAALAPAGAQGLRPGEGRLEETRPPLPEFAPEEEPPALVPPPVPPPAPEPSPAPPPRPGEELSSGVRVYVRAFEFSGNTAFDDATLAAVLEPYTGRTLSTEELIQARDAVTRHYVAEGYVSSGAVLPDQTVEDGVIRLEIVEGRLGEVAVAGLATLDPAFVEDRLRLAAGVPLDVDRLRERIQLLLGDPAIERVNARLGPGRELGESRLELDVVEAPPYRTDLRISNDRSPAIGAEGAELAVTFGNLLGRSDPLRLQLEVSEGLRDFTAGYSVPLDRARSAPVRLGRGQQRRRRHQPRQRDRRREPLRRVRGRARAAGDPHAEPGAQARREPRAPAQRDLPAWAAASRSRPAPRTARPTSPHSASASSGSTAPASRSWRCARR